MATTTPNTRTQMRASMWNRAFAAVCPRIVALDAVNGTSDALAVRCVR